MFLAPCVELADITVVPDTLQTDCSLIFRASTDAAFGLGGWFLTHGYLSLAFFCLTNSHSPCAVRQKVAQTGRHRALAMHTSSLQTMQSYNPLSHGHVTNDST